MPEIALTIPVAIPIGIGQRATTTVVPTDTRW